MPQRQYRVARLLLVATGTWTALSACTGTMPQPTGTPTEQASVDARAIFAPYAAPPGAATDPARRHIWSGAMRTLIRRQVTRGHPMFGTDWLCDCDHRNEGPYNVTVTAAQQNPDGSVTVSVRLDPPSNEPARFVHLSMVRERMRWVVDDLMHEDHDLSLRGDILANRSGTR